MAKLDENYLELVRQSLYNKTSASSRSSKPTKKQKQIEATNIINSKGAETFEHFKAPRVRKNVTFSKDIEYGSEPLNSGSIKDRICTPFKSLAQRETVTSEDNSDSINKGKKRRLSICDPTEIVRKKKKKPTNSEGNAVHLGLASFPDIKIKKKSLKKNLKTKDKKKLEVKIKQGLITLKETSHNNLKLNNSALSKGFFPSLKSTDSNTYIKSNSIKPTLNGEVNISKNLVQSPIRTSNKAKTETSLDKAQPNSNNTISTVDFNSNKHSRKKKVLRTDTDILETNSYSAETNTHAADFYDNQNVRVKGMKFNKFVSLFPNTHRQQLHKTSYTFRIPQKYFKGSCNDDFDWNIKISRPSKPINKIVSPDSSHQDKLNGNSTLHNSSSETEESVEDLSVEKSTQNQFETTKEVLDNSSNFEMEQTFVTQTDTNTSKPDIISLKNASKIVILPQLNQTIHFNGLCYLDVLNGQVEILGASLNKHSGTKKVYSPRGTSLLYIKNTTCKISNNETKLELKDLISEELLNEKDQSLTLEQHSAVLLCKELKEPYIEFIENHISQIIFPDSTPRMNFELSGSWNKTRVAELWADLVENLSEDSKTVICGGKGVGKSTFLRFAVNQLLKRFKKIRIIELDPGQSEFYPPGCISVTTVDQDVLGPNYTHLQAADRLVLSNINVGYDVKQYLNSVQYLLDTMEVQEIMPTLINFPGFTSGLGLGIAANTLKMLQPTHVFEIKSKSFSKNYKMDMTAENVTNFIKANKLFDNRHIGNQLNYSFTKFESLCEKNEAWSLEARQARELCILSYFGKALSANGKDLSSSDNLFSIQISTLTIISLEGKRISPLAVNGSVVVLCSTSLRNPNIFEAHGYGFVRGIDLDNDTLVLLTPEPIENLENVSHLVLSSVTTPPALLMSASAVRGHVPYVSMGDLVDFGQLTKRSYLPPKK